MAQCTWSDCEKNAEHDQVGASGQVWSRLCEEHHCKLKDSLTIRNEQDMKGMIGNWIKAQGGAVAAAKRM